MILDLVGGLAQVGVSVGDWSSGARSSVAIGGELKPMLTETGIDITYISTD